MNNEDFEDNSYRTFRRVLLKPTVDDFSLQLTNNINRKQRLCTFTINVAFYQCI